MSKRGKVGTGGREIQKALYGGRQRPETAAYADLCASRGCNKDKGSLVVTEVIEPDPRTRESLIKSGIIKPA